MNHQTHSALGWSCALLILLHAGCSGTTTPGPSGNGNANSANDNTNSSNANDNGSGDGGKNAACADDDLCNVSCFMDADLPIDPDCTNADICDQTGGSENNGFCCTPDLNCDTDCPEADPECAQAGIVDGQLCADFCETAGDGDCSDGGSGATGSACDFGGDCTDCGSRSMDDASENDLECFVSAFCCSGDQLCDDGCADPDPDCDP